MSAVTAMMRSIVLDRDKGCVAPLIDKDAGPCHDKWGERFPNVHVTYEVQPFRQGTPDVRVMEHGVPTAVVATDPDRGTFTLGPADLELDYIRGRDAKGPRHLLAGDHVMLCAGHHRGTGPQRGVIWATAHREALRAYLDGF